MMKVNRNTINGDIQYWYVRIIKNVNVLNPENLMIANIERLELQRTRLREQLDKTSNTAEKITIERLILDIDYKILHTYQKISESVCRVHTLATNWLNNQMKKDKKDERYMTFFDTISVSKKAEQRIKQIINEDRSKGNFM